MVRPGATIGALIVLIVGGLALIAAVVVTYYVISYAVLFAIGKLLPLTGRRSSRRSRRT